MKTDIVFTPSHYAQCIGCYEIDITESCTVNCGYCSLKNKITAASPNTQIPDDIKEKGIYLSPNSDPFSLLARDDAHDILARFLPQGVPFLIITKNKIPQKTIDLMAKYPSQVYVQISLSRLDNALNAYIEPGAATAEERLETIRLSVDAGLRVTPVMMPLFPHIDDTVKKLSAMVKACAVAGAKYLKASYVIIDPSDPIQMLKIKSNGWTNLSLNYLNQQVKIHIGSGLTVNMCGRKWLYNWMTYLCNDHGMQFQSCPILDPAVLDMENVRICATYRKKQLHKTKEEI